MIELRSLSQAQPVYLPREGLDAVPTFHAQGRFEQVETVWPTPPAKDHEDRLWTECGLLVYRYSRARGELVDRTRLRADHALAFGRPCYRCFSDAPAFDRQYVGE